MSSSDSIGYTHDFLTEFIQLYRSHPCLWQVRCKGYKDRLLRNRAYDALVRKLREVNVEADRNAVIRKINTLRTAFRREYKKVQESRSNVGNLRRRYRSSLWYYDLLKFVAEQNEGDTQREMRQEMRQEVAKEEAKGIREIKEVKNDETVAECYQEEMLIQEVEKTEPLSPAPSPAPTPVFQPVILETEGSYRGGRFESARKGRPENVGFHESHQFKTVEPMYEVQARQIACGGFDDFDTFGRYVAGKLRKSTARQGIIAEKIIADVLLRANLGSLKENTVLREKVPSRCFKTTEDR